MVELVADVLDEIDQTHAFSFAVVLRVDGGEAGLPARWVRKGAR
jgi:hypothetical protein